MTTTINLTRPDVAANLAISAAPPGGAVRATAGESADPLGWLAGRLRVPGRHRPARRRRAVFLQVVARLGSHVRTMSTTARNYGWSAAAAAAFTGAGWSVNTTLGLVVLGASCVWMDLRTGE